MKNQSLATLESSMIYFPSPIPPDREPRKSKARGIRFAVLIIALIILIILLALIPWLFFILAPIVLILCLIGVFRKRVPWLRIHGRKKAGALAGVAVLVFFTSAGIIGSQVEGPATEATNAGSPIVASESPTPTPSPTSIADYIGEPCDGDELVMEQDTEKLYCDQNASKVLLWTTSEDHKRAEDAVKKAADEKAAAAKRAADEKAAAEKAAEDKAAADKKIAEDKAQAEAAAEKAAAKKNADDQAAEKEAARVAELEAEQEAYEAPAKVSSNTYYANCSAVRAAGAAPIYAGDPGYSGKLDRDGDGVACES